MNTVSQEDRKLSTLPIRLPRIAMQLQFPNLNSNCTLIITFDTSLIKSYKHIHDCERTKTNKSIKEISRKILSGIIIHAVLYEEEFRIIDRITICITVCRIGEVLPLFLQVF